MSLSVKSKLITSFCAVAAMIAVVITVTSYNLSLMAEAVKEVVREKPFNAPPRPVEVVPVLLPGIRPGGQSSCHARPSQDQYQHVSPESVHLAGLL